MLRAAPLNSMHRACSRHRRCSVQRAAAPRCAALALLPLRCSAQRPAPCALAAPCRLATLLRSAPGDAAPCPRRCSVQRPAMRRLVRERRTDVRGERGLTLLNTPAICWSSACAAALMPLTLVTHNGGCTPFIPAPTRPCTTTALLCCGLAPWAGCLLEPAPACVRSVVLLLVLRPATAPVFIGFS